MTAIRQTSVRPGALRQPTLRQPAARQSRPQLTAVSLSPQALMKSSSPVMVMARTATLGILVISALSLIMNILTSQGVYEVAHLKQEKKELNITTQILAEQVDSLSSDQNLTSAAHQLGMVANTNPVFLRVNDHKIFGRPKAAISDTSSRINGSLVPNAAQIKRTKVAALLAAEAQAKAARAAQQAADDAAAKSAALSAVPATTNALKSSTTTGGGVAKSKPLAPQVPLSTSRIPASPTN